MRTPEEFEQAVKERKITEWKLRECSFCRYPLNYVFLPDGVYLDRGCDCTGQTPNLVRRTWKSLAEHYNIQTDADYIAEMDTFWFPNSPTPTCENCNEKTVHSATLFVGNGNSDIVEGTYCTSCQMFSPKEN